MAFNKFTQITPAHYDARSLQETLYLPTLKRKQHDKLENQAAVTKSQLDKFDALDEYSDMAQEEKERLTSQMDSFSEQLAKQGVNSSSKSKFLDIAGDYSKSTSESGKLYKIDAIRRKYLTDKEKILADANAKGYSPEQNLKNLEQAYQAHFENNDPEDLKFIDLPQAPEFYGVAEAVNEFRDKVGQTTFNEILNAGSYKVDENGVIQIDKSSVTTASNLNQLEHFRDLLNQNLTAEGSKGRVTANWQGRSTEDITKEINSVINTMKSVKQINDEQRSFNFSTVPKGGPTDTTDKNEGLTTKHSTDQQISLGMETYEEVENALSNLQNEYDEAKSIPNNKEREEELAYKIRELETVKTKINKSAGRFDEMLNATSDVFINSLNKFINTEATPEQQQILSQYTEELLTSDFSIKGKGADQEKLNFYKNDDGSYTFAIIPYKERSRKSKEAISLQQGATQDDINYETDNENIIKVRIPKTLGETIETTRNATKSILNKRNQFIDAETKFYTFEREIETPIFKNSSDETYTNQTTLKLFGNANSITPQDIVIRDENGKADESFKDNPNLQNIDISEAVTNFISANAKELAPNAQIKIGQVGNRVGYVVKIKIDKDLELNNDIFSGEDVPENGNIEMFVPINEQIVNDPNSAQGYFYQQLNSETKSAIKRNIRYANINPTVNENNLGKNYNISAAKITKNPNDNYNIDFLQTFKTNPNTGKEEKEITIEKVNPKNPGNSIGKMKWNELYDNNKYQGMGDYFLDIDNENTKKDFLSLLLSNFDKEEMEEFSNAEDQTGFLTEKFKDGTIKLKNKNEINILLSVTDN